VSFELKPDERIGSELRRLARKELRKARTTLGRAHPPTTNAIHDARKSLKKARAIVELIDDPDAKGIDNSTKRLRKVARALSRVRDTDAMFEIVDKLRRKDRRLFDAQTLKRLRAWFSKRRKAVLSEARRKHTWRSVDDRLGALRRKAKDWKPAHDEFRVLSRGVTRTHRRGRKAMTKALRRRGADDFHRLRKAIKNLWYELRLLEPASPRIARDVRALHQAETWLGDDHNVVVLCASLSKDDSAGAAPLSVERLQAAADRYHTQARRKAVEAVRPIYRRKSRPYVRDLKRVWKRWRQSTKR